MKTALRRRQINRMQITERADGVTTVCAKRYGQRVCLEEFRGEQDGKSSFERAVEYCDGETIHTIKYGMDLFADLDVKAFAQFEELPADCQKAIREYCHEGVAPDEFYAHVAQYRFLLADVPLDRIESSIMSGFEANPSGPEFNSFEEYHKWYLDTDNIEDHGPSRWPCMLSGFEDETFQDGWHRFHSYVRAGDHTIPVLVWITKK